jgi:hypothetical protein
MNVVSGSGLCIALLHFILEYYHQRLNRIYVVWGADEYCSKRTFVSEEAQYCSVAQ